MVLNIFQIGKYLNFPCVKFISHFASFLAFVFLVVASYQENGAKQENFEKLFPQYYEVFKNYSQRNDSIRIKFSDFYIRKHSPSNLDIIISIWLIGQTFHEMKHLIEWGIYNYLYSSTNTVNLCMNVLYVTSYGIAYISYFLVKKSLREIEKPEFWERVKDLNENDTKSHEKIYETFYWLNSGM